MDVKATSAVNMIPKRVVYFHFSLLSEYLIQVPPSEGGGVYLCVKDIGQCLKIMEIMHTIMSFELLIKKMRKIMSYMYHSPDFCLS